MNIDMETYRKQVEESAAFLQSRIDESPEVVLVLGTGLGGVAEIVAEPVVFPYKAIPHFPKSTVESHDGNLIFGKLGAKRVAALQGRFHFYEGYSTKELTFPIRVLSLLKPGTIIVANAAGGLNLSFSAGTLMIIRDHLNFIGENPLRGPNIDEWGPRFPDLSEAYDRQLIDLTLGCAKNLDIPNISPGVYAAISGPSLETPAETRFLRNCGGDAAGMSTVPEVLVARHAGLRVLGISVIANVNDPDDFKPIILEEVIEQSRKAEPLVQRLVVEVLKNL